MKITQVIEGIALFDQVWLTLVVASRVPVLKQLHPAMRCLWGYLGFVALIELVSKLYIYNVVSGSNLYLLHIYTLGEFAWLGALYYYLLQGSKGQRRTLQAYLAVALVSIAGYSAFQLMGDGSQPDHFELYSKLVVNGTMMALSATYFIQILMSPARYLAHFHSSATINSGVLLYFSGSFVIYLIMNQLIRADLSDTRYLWLINALLAVVFHLVCAIGLWKKDSRLTKASRYG